MKANVSKSGRKDLRNHSDEPDIKALRDCQIRFSNSEKELAKHSRTEGGI